MSDSPTADFTVSPSFGSAPLAVTFYNKSTPDGVQVLFTGDGQMVDFKQYPNGFPYTYKKAGTFSAMLQMRSSWPSGELLSSAVKTILVTAPPPTPVTPSKWDQIVELLKKIFEVIFGKS
jgi:PKD repeat protein